MRGPRKTDFSDGAKRRAGVEPFDLALEIKTLKAAAESAAVEHNAALQRFRDRVRDAIAVMEEGRRGDGLALLRALMRSRDGKLQAPTPPTEPSAA